MAYFSQSTINSIVCYNLLFVALESTSCVEQVNLNRVSGKGFKKGVQRLNAIEQQIAACLLMVTEWRQLHLCKKFF